MLTNIKQNNMTSAIIYKIRTQHVVLTELKHTPLFDISLTVHHELIY